MDKIVIVNRKDFDSYKDFEIFCQENKIPNPKSNWIILEMYGEITLVAILED